MNAPGIEIAAPSRLSLPGATVPNLLLSPTELNLFSVLLSGLSNQTDAKRDGFESRAPEKAQRSAKKDTKLSVPFASKSEPPVSLPSAALFGVQEPPPGAYSGFVLSTALLTDRQRPSGRCMPVADAGDSRRPVSTAIVPADTFKDQARGLAGALPASPVQSPTQFSAWNGTDAGFGIGSPRTAMPPIDQAAGGMSTPVPFANPAPCSSPISFTLSLTPRSLPPSTTSGAWALKPALIEPSLMSSNLLHQASNESPGSACGRTSTAGRKSLVPFRPSKPTSESSMPVAIENASDGSEGGDTPQPSIPFIRQNSIVNHALIPACAPADRQPVQPVENPVVRTDSRTVRNDKDETTKVDESAGIPEAKADQNESGPAVPARPSRIVSSRSQQRSSGQDPHEDTTALLNTKPARAAVLFEEQSPKSSAIDVRVPTQAGMQARDHDRVSESIAADPKQIQVSANSHAQPAREINLKLEDANAARVDVRLTQRAGRVQVVVRSQDPQLGKSLQRGLGDLVNRLEHGGFKTESWIPSAVREHQRSASAPYLRSDGRFEPPGSGTRDQEQHPPRQSPKHRQRFHWAANLEEILLAEEMRTKVQ